MSRLTKGSTALLCLAFLVCGYSSHAQANSPAGAAAPRAEDMPRLVEKDGRYALLVNDRPYLILAGQINNSSSWPEMMPGVWAAVAKLHANTVEAPIYWEQMEPRPGSFDFSTVDMLVNQARSHNVHLVLLWFGTWKNGRMHYTPEWIKTDTKHYPRMIDARGEPIDVLSPNAAANLEADKTAFAALMRHLREIDGGQHTVLLIQVENGPGALGTVRDFSAEADRQFAGQAPAELVKALGKRPGTWKQVFGPDADEIFETYSVAHYIDQVARAGKQEFALPMYCNVWLGSRSGIPGVNYPSGGAVAHMLDVWKATAHAIDMIGPDIYIRDSQQYRQVLASYHRRDNPTWIPETITDDAGARYFFYALGMDAIGFSPFGIDNSAWKVRPFADLVSRNYALLEPIDREIAAWNFAGRLKTAVEDSDTSEVTLDFGKWQAQVTFPMHARQTNADAAPEHNGRIVIAQLADDEFLVTGFDADVTFQLSPKITGEHLQLLRVEEGGYQNGNWQMSRLWNGDQTDHGLVFRDNGGPIVRVTLGTY